MRWPRFLPDLTLWHAWHTGRGSLPTPWRGLDLPAICRSLGVSTWAPRKPWSMELAGIDVRDERGATERSVTWKTPLGVLTSRWVLGPDGDWWQAEYPVKSGDDLEAARLVAQARRYTVTDRSASTAAGDIDAIELPQRPWSELFHSFLGWSEGIVLFLEEGAALQSIVEVLEEKLATLERELAALPGDAALLPDNLDGQFISPDAFDQHLGPSYARAVGALHAGGKTVVVHVGGPAARLITGLAESGVDCVQGVCGAPQGDSPLPEARAAAGPRLVLWGGIPQDALLASCSEPDFSSAADRAFDEASRDALVVVGVADKVPAEALPERIGALAERSRQVPHQDGDRLSR